MKRILSIILITVFLVSPINVQAHDCYDSTDYEYLLSYYLVEYPYSTYTKQEVMRAIYDVCSTSITGDMSDYEKLKVVTQWIVDNMSYDYSYYNRTAYSALYSDNKGFVVCTGFATLFYYFCQELQIECEVVIGHYGNEAEGFEAGEQNINHAWNIVKMGDKWYEVDLVVADGYKEAGYTYKENIKYTNKKHKKKTYESTLFFGWLQGTEGFKDHYIVDREALYSIGNYDMSTEDYNYAKGEVEILVRKGIAIK